MSMKKIRVGITGYGNLGKGVEYALENVDDMELVGVFSRRSPDQVNVRTGVPVYSMQQAEQMKEQIDVMIVCGGSANDLPVQTAQLRRILILLTALTHTQKYPSILPMSMKSVQRAERSALFPPDGIRECFP